MEKVSKKNYEAPTMRVVEFRVENGFTGSDPLLRPTGAGLKGNLIDGNMIFTSSQQNQNAQMGDQLSHHSETDFFDRSL